MKNKIILLVLVSGILLVDACKKEDNTSNNTPAVVKTQRDYLIDGKWQITSIKVAVPLVGTQDMYDTLASCRKDNFATFKSSGSVHSDEGATKCSSSAPQIDSSGTWSLTSDFKKLTANVSWVPSSNKTFDVLELTTTSLKICQTFDTTYLGFPVTIKDTVTAKNIN